MKTKEELTDQLIEEYKEYIDKMEELKIYDIALTALLMGVFGYIIGILSVAFL